MGRRKRSQAWSYAFTAGQGTYDAKLVAAAEATAELKDKGLWTSETKSSLWGEESHRRRDMKYLQRELERLKSETEAADEQLILSVEENVVIANERREALEYSANLMSQLEKLDGIKAKLPPKKQTDLLRLQRLVAVERALKEQEEKVFKGKQRQRLTRLLEAQQEVQAGSAGGSENGEINASQFHELALAFCKEELDNVEEAYVMRAIEKRQAEVIAEQEELKRVLTHRRIVVAKVNRAAGDRSGNYAAELMQYHTQLNELADEVTARGKTFQNMTSTFASLDLTRQFLMKEIKVINSICDNFQSAFESKSSKEEFLRQFQTIVQGIEESLSKQQRLLRSKHIERDELKKQVQEMSIEMRQYSEAVVDLRKECERYYALERRLGSTEYSRS